MAQGVECSYLANVKLWVQALAPPKQTNKQTKFSNLQCIDEVMLVGWIIKLQELIGESQELLSPFKNIDLNA
jgi:hypothetical protein